MDLVKTNRFFCTARPLSLKVMKQKCAKKKLHGTLGPENLGFARFPRARAAAHTLTTAVREIELSARNIS